MKKLLLALLLSALLCFAQNPNTAKWPDNSVTENDLGVASFRAQSTLTADINSSVNTVPVSSGDGSKFKTGNVIVVDSEAMLITAIVGDNLTVTRAADHTSATSHTTGSYVSNYNVPGYHNQLAAEIVALENNFDYTKLINKPVAFNPTNHASTHGSGQSDPISINWSQIAAGVPSAFNPSTHAATHNSGQNDALSGTLAVSITGNSDTLDTYHATNVANAYSHSASWAIVDQVVALPTGTSNLFPGFAHAASAVTITGARCWSDVGDAVVQLRRSDGSDIVNSNLTCNGSLQTSMAAAAAIATSQYVSTYVVSGTSPKKVTIAITFTTAY